MARGDGTPTTESKWKFPRAFEGVTRLFGVKKEQPDPEPDPERFSVLDELPNTGKKDLLTTFESLQKRDTENGLPDVSSHVIDLFVDEIASGEIITAELFELAPFLVKEVQNRPVKTKDKKKATQVAKYAGIYYMSGEHHKLDLIESLVWKIERVYEQKRIFGKISPEQTAALRPEQLKIKATKIAEKIIGAPEKFDNGLSVYMEAQREALTQKEAAFFTKNRVLLTPEAVKKIFEFHPNDYEQATERYEEVFARAGLLEAGGLTKEAQIAKNLDIFFSPLDGTMLRTPEERLAYIEDLLNPIELKVKWRQEKIYGDRDKAPEFVAREVIPELLANNVPFEEVVKQMHWFLVSGSYDQLDACRTLKENMAGEYRKCHVSVGIYPGPDEKLVPEMMAKLARQVELFSAQLEAMKEGESSESFEEKVHQFACHVTHRFVDVHPMADGNGRTARSLRSYIMSKHLGMEKMREYNAVPRDSAHYGDTRAGKLLEHLRYGQPMLRDEEVYTYSGSTLSTKFRSTVRADQPLGLNVWHEPLMAHLEEADIQTEVFDNKKLVSFANHAKEIIDGKQTYGWY